jgi:hypothetical protein
MFTGILCALGACGGEDSDGGASVEPVTMESFWSKLEEVGCKKAFRCCSGGSPDDVNTGGNWKKGASSPRVCKPQGLFDDEQDARLAMVKRNTLVFHGDDAARCLQDWENLDCESFFNHRIDHEPASCKEAFEDKIPAQSACELSYECAGGLGCIGSSKTGYRCQVIPERGDPCTGYCPYGTYCSALGICADSKEEGASCTYGNSFECKGFCSYDTKTCGPPFVFTPACTG